jgi:hypothetical protein
MGVSLAGLTAAAAAQAAPAVPVMEAAPDDHAAVIEVRRLGASPAVRELVRHVVTTGDNEGRPWAVVDKHHTRLFVFDPDGRLAGATPALLGLAKGDFSAPGVGQKAATFVPPEERTTPAGRFISRPGRNLKGEAVVWVEYATAFAIHRLRPAPAHERRAQRLASPTTEDNRISLGCVVVSGAFYDDVVAPMLGSRFGVVYVMPENGANWAALFDRTLLAAL